MERIQARKLSPKTPPLESAIHVIPREGVECLLHIQRQEKAMDIPLLSQVNQVDRRLWEHRRELSASAQRVTHRTLPATRDFPPIDFGVSKPMQLGTIRAALSQEGRLHQRQLNLCMYCGNPGHYQANCPIRQAVKNKSITLVKSTLLPLSGPHVSVPLTLKFPGGMIKTRAMIDSGTCSCFMDLEFAQTHSIPCEVRPTPLFLTPADGTTVKSLSYRFQAVDHLEKYRPPLPKAFEPPIDLNQSMTESSDKSKLSELLKLIDWPAPPITFQNFKLSTSPQKCDFYLLSPRNTYRVGETLQVVITARDHTGSTKAYGGDFFQAKLHSPALKAGVTGRVEDYNNGTYLTTFLLLWPGEAQVHIRLIHSSEAVDVLKKKRELEIQKIYFNGYFQFNKSSAVVECNVELARTDICTYKDPVTGDTWQCVKPKNMPCHSLIYHSMGGYRKVTNALEDSLLSGSVTAKTISGSAPPINVIADSTSLDLTSNLPTCSPGQEPIQPSGFYYKDSWTSLKCSARHFPQPTDALACLKEKDIHMFGDSTLRQWFEYLVAFIPSLERVDLHVNYQSGPLLAVDAKAGLVVRWRAHGLPLRTTKTMMSDLHYEAAHLAGIGGGPHTVVVLTLWAHFTTYPVTFYLERLEKVRESISSLLFRSPQTKVIIKSANTGYKSVYGSDWLSLQLDILLRAAFKGMVVTIIDAWDMTSCHYLLDNIHPGQPVIRNEVDLMLSYICPT
ncbi:NXPE family member 3-like [Gastrophryne carolinensis]